ncbi:membrane protein [Acrocarpospora corrugata]|uniref:Membrane protein n=1 Tax=Acrocarpospora corrugata TaxID=35763 RepID=A0A5M3W444_9ACTN|nr:DUF3105 domain-containing protein [Acrocarpospora corrugata]GES03827.1 membrane protein [Acrocarpospora corrugata]
MTKEKAQARRDHLARMRAEQKRKERRMAVLMWGIGGLVIAIVVGAVGFYIVREEMNKSEVEKAAAQAEAAMAPKVKNFKYTGSQHTGIKVKYAESPPVGGEHNSAWQNCGIYSEPINNETAVHSMEHGAVWITYQPDLPEPDIAKLRTLASSDYMLLSPYPGLTSKVGLSSWNHQLLVDSADSPDIAAFIRKFKQGPDTPERGSPCTGGVDQTAAEAVIPETAPSEQPAPSATTGTDAPVATPSAS